MLTATIRAGLGIFLGGCVHLLASASFAAGWNETAGRAALDFWERHGNREGIVTYVDGDGRHVYFTGLPVPLLDSGMPVYFVRQDKSSEWILVGKGVVESSQGSLAWAAVESEIGKKIDRDDRVRLQPNPPRVHLEPFRLESRSGLPRSTAFTRIFQSLLRHHLTRLGISPVPSADQSDLLIAGLIRTGSDSPLTVLLTARRRGLGDTSFSNAYTLDADPGFDPEEDIGPAGPADPMGGSIPADEPVPPGLVRLSLYTPPAADSGWPAWPPKTPADRIILAAVAAPLTDLGSLSSMPSPGPPGPSFLLTLPEDPRPETWSARRLESVLNARRDMPLARLLLGEYEFKARSDTELVLYTKIPAADLADALSDPIFFPLDPSHPSPDFGNGPYRIDSLMPTRIVLAARPGRGRTKLSPGSPETIVLTVDTESKPRQARFELGESDIHEISDAEFLKYTGATAYLDRIVRGRVPVLQVLLFNLSTAPLNDLQFRRAVAMAIDRRAALEVLLNNRGSVARGFLWTPGSSTALFSKPRSIPAAKDLLKNLRRQIPLRLTVPAEDPAYSIIAERIRADLRPLSIAVEIQRVTWADYEDRLRAGQFDLALAAWPQGRSARLWLYRHFTSSSPENFTGYRNEAFDALASPESDLSAAHDLLAMDVPAIPLFWLSRYFVLGERVRSASFEESPFFSLDQIRLAP